MPSLVGQKHELANTNIGQNVASTGDVQSVTLRTERPALVEGMMEADWKRHQQAVELEWSTSHCRQKTKALYIKGTVGKGKGQGTWGLVRAMKQTSAGN